MSKRAAKNNSNIGVGQPALQIVFPFFTEEETRHTAGETEVNEPPASTPSSSIRHKPERKRKWYSLIDKVYALPNLWEAWIRVKTNRGAPGIDKMTIARFNEDAYARIEQLASDLKQRTYRPQPVRRKLIPKSGGGQRPLGIPTVRDRIVQQALLQILEPIFEAKFSDRSHGFRKERGCSTALSVVDRAVKHGYTWVVDADIRAFFDTVDHEKLLKAVGEEVADGSVLNLITHILKAGLVEPSVGEVEPTELGTPQGGPLSPLLANIYLHAFDTQIAATRPGQCGLVRYADDFVLFAKSEEAAREALSFAREILEGELSLTMHPEKTRVVSVAEGFEFLGFHYFRDPRTNALVKEVRRKSVLRFREVIRSRTPRLKTQRRVKAKHVTLPRLRSNQRLGDIIASVNRQLRGWHGYFHAVWSRYPASPFCNFDGYVRGRIRSSITGRIGHGWWDVRLSNRVLAELGLVSLDTLQSKRYAGSSATPARKGKPGGEPYAGNPHVRFG